MMSVLNNSLFRIFRDVVYCSVINVLRCCSRDSSFRLSHLLSLVNNFFNLFFTVLCDPFVSRDSFVRISPVQRKVNTFFNIFFMFFQKYNFTHNRIKKDVPWHILLVYVLQFNIYFIIRIDFHYHICPLSSLLTRIRNTSRI